MKKAEGKATERPTSGESEYQAAIACPEKPGRYQLRAWFSLVDGSKTSKDGEEAAYIKIMSQEVEIEIV